MNQEDINEAIFRDLFAAPQNRTHAPSSIPEPDPAGGGVKADSGVDVANEVIVAIGYCRTSGPIEYSDGRAQYARLGEDGRVYYVDLEWDGENKILPSNPVGQEFTEEEAPESAVLGRPVAS